MYLWEQDSYCKLYRELWIDYDVKSQESKMLNQMTVWGHLAGL